MQVFLNVVLEHAAWRGMPNNTLVTLIRLERTLNEEREASNQMELNLNCDIADLKVNFLVESSREQSHWSWCLCVR